MEISEYLPSIGQAVRDNLITIRSAPTGAGKSLAIPAYLAESEPNLRVLTAVPTVAAVDALSLRQRSTHPNLKIGHGAEGIIDYSSDSSISYVTAGHLYRKMLSFIREGTPFTQLGSDFREKKPKPLDVLMVDEVHLETVETDLILALWKYENDRGRPVPKLLITSATVTRVRLFPDVPIVEVSTPSYPVTPFYLERDFALDDPNLYQKAGQMAAKLIVAATGDLLIFTPGQREMNLVLNSIGRSGLDLSQYEILPAHREVGDILKLFQISPNKKRIIIGTNIAETSITIPNLAIVIDTLTERREELSFSGGKRLELHHISQSSATQRAGRTGRTMPGQVYRMMTEASFANLEATRPPAIERTNVDEVIVDLLSAKLDPVVILTMLGLPRATIDRDLTDLNRLNLVNHQVVTSAGQLLTELPLGARPAAFLYQWLQRKDLPVEPGVIMAALIDSAGPSYLSYDEVSSSGPQPLMDYRAKYFDQYRGISDLETAVNIWVKLGEGGLNVLEDTLEVRARVAKLKLRERKIMEVIGTVRAILAKKSITSQARVVTNLLSTKWSVLIPLAEEILISVYTDRRMIRGDGGYFLNDQLYTLNELASPNSFISTSPIELIGLVLSERQTTEVQGRIRGSTIVMAISGVPRAARGTTQGDFNFVGTIVTEDFVTQAGFREAAITQLSDSASAGQLPYPFKVIPGPLDLLSRLAKPNSIRLTANWPGAGSVDRFGDRIVGIVPTDEDPEGVDGLTDLFNEQIRITARRKGQLSPHEVWVSKTRNRPIFDEALNSRILGTYIYRKALSKFVTEVTAFRPSWAIGLLQVLKITDPIRILDLSTGYGSWLIAAIAANHAYQGFDPDVRLEQGHDEMIRQLAGPSQASYRVTYSPSEESALSDTFGLIVFFPPSFEEEVIGAADISQAGRRYPHRDDYLVRFIFEALFRAWDHLQVGGYLIVGSMDGDREDFFTPLTFFVADYLVGAVALGAVGLVEPQVETTACRIWAKSSEITFRNPVLASRGYYGLEEKIRNMLGLEAGRGRVRPPHSFSGALASISKRDRGKKPLPATSDTIPAGFYAPFLGDLSTPPPSGSVSSLEEAEVKYREIRDTVNRAKQQLDVLSQDLFSRAMTETDPFSDLLSKMTRTLGQTVNNEWLKIFELLNRNTMVSAPTTDPLTVMVAGAGVAAPVQYYLELHHTVPISTTEISVDQFQSVEGVVGVITSTLTLNPAGLDLFVSDVYAGVTSYDRQEEQISKLTLGQIVVALRTVKVGGSCIIKQDTFFTLFSRSLLAIISNLFTTFTIAKPQTSKARNSEIYLVGQGFLGAPDEYFNLLVSLLAAETNELVDSILPGSTSIETLAVLAHSDQVLLPLAARLFGDLQVRAIEDAGKIYGSFLLNESKARETAYPLKAQYEADWLARNNIGVELVGPTQSRGGDRDRGRGRGRGQGRGQGRGRGSRGKK